MTRWQSRCPLDDSFVERTILLRRLESLICLVVVLIAMALGMYYYTGFFNRVKILATLGPLQEARVDVLYYWNINGAWPPETQSALDLIGFETICKHEKRLQTTFEDGVIQMRGLEGDLTGHLVSVHPALPQADRLGPVHWRFGPYTRDSRVAVHGNDRTTLPHDHILSLLQ